MSNYRSFGRGKLPRVGEVPPNMPRTSNISFGSQEFFGVRGITKIILGVVLVMVPQCVTNIAYPAITQTSVQQPQTQGRVLAMSQ